MSRAIFRAGHDVATVAGQNMVSASDADLIGACRKESRALVTLDLDFSNPLIFPPGDFAGIAVLRPPKTPTYDDLVSTVKTLITAIPTENLLGHLWSVEIGKTRIYQPPA